MKSKLTDDTKVFIHYGDGSKAEETIKETRVKFKAESKVWRDNFFHALEDQGYTYTKFARYSLKPGKD